MTNEDGTAAAPQSRLSRVIQAAGSLTALLAAASAVVLAVTGRSEHIPAAAGLGGIGLIGGAAPATINVIKNARLH
ncbi:hypothetical protein ACIQM0_10370 [Streptomyces sp. NPDC091387]|uniref:hypothetical protein n=1 Tax=Streptomyces sp. NPDC091387 TaxID=3365998 RepID=UPI0037FCC25B